MLQLLVRGSNRQFGNEADRCCEDENLWCLRPNHLETDATVEPPQQAFEIGRERMPHYDETKWEATREGTMKRILLCKLHQCQEMMQALIATGERRLFESSPTAANILIVLIGENFPGKDLLAQLLEKLRPIASLIENTGPKERDIHGLTRDFPDNAIGHGSVDRSSVPKTMTRMVFRA